MYNNRYNDTQANTSILWILGGKQVMCMEFMQLVGYSNNDQKTLASYGILSWRKYLRENIGSER